MAMRFAFVGFRHNHVMDMFARCQERTEIDVVACCEEDASTRDALAAGDNVRITHSNFAQLLETTECDVVAVGDCYGRRGELAIAALEAGRHVISDKPLCISLPELDEIERLASERKLTVGCMLDSRDLPVFAGIREQLQAGVIGEVRTISFDGQHPLMFGKRPDWYFEPGMHGGTLNDIAIHAIDLIPWATGFGWQSIVGARCWNGRLPQFPHFQECGQAILTLENGAGVMGDVSYLSPDSFAYQMPLYWRFTLWGDGGVLEAAINRSTITLYRDGEVEPREIALPAGRPGGYLDAFLADVAGKPEEHALTSADVLRAARISLKLQQIANDSATEHRLA